MNAIL